MHFPGLSCSGSGSWILHKGQTWLGLCFLPFPGPRSSGDQVLGEHTVPGLWSVLSPSRSQPLYLLGAQRVHHLRCAGCLLRGADLRLRAPGRCQPSMIPGTFISNWKPAHSLVEDAVSGAKIASCLPALIVACLPLCLRWRMDWSAAS